MKFWTLTAAAIVSAATVTAAPPAMPQTPVAVQDILFAQPFTLAQGYQFDWSKERPTVTSGQLVVFQVAPDLVYPRQSYEPVLYVGSTTAERLNVGYLSGRVVAIVPDTVGPDGKLVRQDLSKAWFGQPNILPSDVTTQVVAQEAQLAAQVGVQPLSSDKVDHARLAGGEAAKLKSKHALLGLAAKLVSQYAPDEVELAADLESSSKLAK